ncbi:hypothetical protein [Rivularia sp. UHCC 0363]|uniref:hypothetical protein n=1 Tax=Rivularia sp. UHCC 0363 TaxID=3110244 RepID=UPI002B20F438|nr:hypothetical protein [Rivularia sp. UHCC 0363]MEA5599266.1 hypothetical protein [Rivularia sp. UHCC 0363]
MSINLSSLFTTFKVAQAVSSYFNISKNLGYKIDKLMGSELEAGFRALEQASSSVNEEKSLLREARNRFNKAISLETNLKKGIAYLGSSLTHHLLGDKVNALNTLEKILDLEIEASNIFENLGYKFAEKKNSREEVEKNLSMTYLAGLGVGLLCLPFGAVATPIAVTALLTGGFCGEVSNKIRDVEPIENLKNSVKDYLNNTK